MLLGREHWGDGSIEGLSLGRSPGAHPPGTASQDRLLSCGHSNQLGDAVRAWDKTHKWLLKATVMTERWNG